jgi:saccharopepsin
MAYPALAEKGVKPVFDEMMSQHLLTQNIFSFYLTSKQAEAMGMKSDLTLGYYDRAKFTGDVHWNDVQFKYMFGVNLDDVKVNGNSTGLCSGGQKCLITFDSGTSLMSMPSFATDKLKLAGVPTASNPVSCSSEKQFGDLTLVIGGKDYVLSNEEWMFPAQQENLAQADVFQKYKKLGPLGPQVMA